MATVEIIENASEGRIAGWIYSLLAPILAAGDGRIAITLPGGSTPFPIIEHLTGAQLDWRRVDVWPGDDRVVPEDHSASNTGRIRALLEPLGARIVPLAEGAQVPRFALGWLGMGADGHIASLFPSSDPRADDPQPIRSLTPDPLPPEAPFDRITLTIPALANSESLLFVMRGAEKRALFEAAMRGENDLPVARLLAAVQARVTCFV